MILHSASLAIRPPDTVTWTIFSNDAAQRDERALPIRDVTVRWSRPSPRDHLDPAELIVTLRVPDDSPDLDSLVYDAQLRLNVAVSPTANDIVFYGWLSAWESGHPGDGYRDVTVYAVDTIGRLAQYYISSGISSIQVWPEEPIEDRIQRLRDLMPDGTSMDAAPSNLHGTTTLAREVRDRPILDVLRLSVPIGWTINNSSTSYMQAALLTNLFSPRATQPIPIPAAAVEDTGRELSRRGLLTEVGITGQYLGSPTDVPEGRTYYGRTPTGSYRSRYTSSRATYESDVRFEINAARNWANDQVDAASEPRVILRGTPIVFPDRIEPTAHVRQLLHMNNRRGLAIQILGTPDDLDPLHYVIGQEITITGRHLAMTLDLAPGSIHGLTALTFEDARLRRGDFPTRPRLSQQHTSGRPMRIHELAHTTITPPQ